MKLRPLCLAASFVVVVAWSASAQTPAAASSDPPPSLYDRIWRFAEWYRNDDHRVVQRVLFTGRFQHDLVLLESDQGELRESNIRRLRLGPRITFFRRFLLHAEAELNPQERDPVYVRMTDFYVQWNRSAALVLTVGKQGVPFTNEGATSSRELLTIDRSNVGNNIWFPQEYMPGVSASGRSGSWLYRAGIYSAGAMNREFGEFDGGAFALGVLGYDFAESLDVREAALVGNYVYQPPDPRNTFTRQLRHIVSAHFRFEDGRFGARGDLSAAAGYLGQRDLWSVMVMPFWNVTDALQCVVRYTFISSDETNGIRLATYENRVVPGRGDRYSEAYAGANYYFYGHRLKLQSGLQFAEMRDRASDGGEYAGLSWTTGIRVGW
jgi:phosphate-selective porin OprO/OprP